MKESEEPIFFVHMAESDNLRSLVQGTEKEVFDWLSKKGNRFGYTVYDNHSYIFRTALQFMEASQYGVEQMTEHKCLSEEDIRRIFREELLEFWENR